MSEPQVSGTAWRALPDPPSTRLRRLPDVPAYGQGSYAARMAGILAKAIADGMYRQGEALPPLQAMATRWSCARHTVRHAIAILRSHGFVAQQRGGAAYVRGVPEQYEAALGSDETTESGLVDGLHDEGTRTRPPAPSGVTGSDRPR